MHRWEDNLKMDVSEIGWEGCSVFISLRIGLGMASVNSKIKFLVQ
jgi:hypothetical protein